MSGNSLDAGAALAWQRAAIKREFRTQPSAKQRETLDRILALLVYEYRRGGSHSALWRTMDAWGFTPHLVQLEAERGER